MNDREKKRPRTKPPGPAASKPGGAELLERPRRKKTPLIGDGTATFVWQGSRAPELIGDMTRWSPIDTERQGLPFERAGRGVWALTINAERDAYLEYALQVGGKRRLDPLNPRTTPNGFGDVNNYFHMPEAPRSLLFRRRPGIARGQVAARRAMKSRHLIGGRRRVWLYRPAAHGPAPLLLVLDGADYYQRAQMVPLLDNLIAAGEVAPLAMSFVDNALIDRVNEYMRPEGLARLLDFFREELLPWAADFAELRTDPGIHGVLGSSASGYAAMYLGVHHPDIFGHIFCQAGGFGVGRIGAPDLMAIIRHRAERLPLRIHLDCGTYDFLIEGNRAMRRLLEEKGYPLHYREYHAGHNQPAWREQLAGGLAWLYPGAASSDAIRSRRSLPG